MSLTSAPAVSIILCTRNRAHALGKALQALANIDSSQSWEAIIVDNASTDNTAQVIVDAARENPHLRYLRVDQIGLGAARDAAWRVAGGDILSFTDDDCYVQHDFVDQIVTAFDEFPEVGCIGGRILLFNPADAYVTVKEDPDPERIPARTVIRAGLLQGANLSFRRAALIGAGGFDRSLGAGTPFPAEDVDAVAAVLWSGWPVLYDPRPTVAHDHGRKEADIPRLRAGYDAGRGAYRAKYILRRDTRRAYAKAWLHEIRRSREPNSLERMTREMISGARYAWSQGNRGTVLLAAPVAVAAAAYLATRVGVAAGKRTLTSKWADREARSFAKTENRNKDAGQGSAGAPSSGNGKDRSGAGR